VAQPYSYTVRQLVYELGLYLNDAMLVYATSVAADTTHLNSTQLAGQTIDSLIGSEIWPWDTPTAATVSLRRPQVVTANTAAAILTLNYAAFTVAYQTNNRVVLQNFNGRGYPQEKKEFALKMAMMELNTLDTLAYQTIAAPSTTDYWNTLPAGLRSVYRVAGYDAGSGYEYEVSPATWQDRIDLAGWRMNLPLDWQAGDAIRVYGRVDPTALWDSLHDPTTGIASLANYATTVAGEPRKLIQAALPYLLDGKRDDKAAEMVQFAYARTQREMRDRPLANEVFRQ
jgi:hypothetical protein